MARTKETILLQLYLTKASQTALSILNSTSAVSWWILMLDTVATGISILEQLWDAKKAEYEDIIASAVVQTTGWLRAQLFAFQFGYNVSVRPNFTVGYDTIDTSAQIITFCSVNNQYALNSFFGGTGITIAAAKGSVPTALDTTPGGELDQLKAYVAQIIQPGIPYSVVTGAADLLRILCQVKFDSRYINTIQASVFAAIVAYITALEDNILSVDTLFQQIENVEGVKTVIMNEVSARDSVTSYGSSTIVFSAIPFTSVPSSAVQAWTTKFGYMIEETQSGQTWNDTIIFTPVTT